MEHVILIVLIAFVPLVLQIFAIDVTYKRVLRALDHAADRPPFTAVVSIVQLGPQPRAVTRLLERKTRLDLAEIDDLIDARGGTLPLAMSPVAAQKLVFDLQRLGAHASISPRQPRRA